MTSVPSVRAQSEVLFPASQGLKCISLRVFFLPSVFVQFWEQG